ncbi:hypothetical protein [Haloprofundus sp. MHR1]|uniref:DUF7263 family protein n=1 Tax=Haloprofundus sp. MHR1 TaxID=2572921 RepID=UPI0010BF500E|nr:hypothetical protein [Haloprofundus sp. MHR1]QCJ47436.1 hypothetical protein FCF25_10040 [Haloprofundus sp. MHR1]
MTRDERGQANLLVLAVALVVLTAVAGIGVSLADGALESGQRDAMERRAATSLASQLVSADSSTTVRDNVLDSDAVESLTPADLELLAPGVASADVRVQIGESTVVERGTPSGGATVRRVVLVADETTENRRVNVSDSDSVTLPRRTTRVDVSVDTGPETTVETVRVNDRVALHSEDGLDGETTLRTSRYETLTLDFDVEGSEAEVALAYYPERTTKAVLTVTVDA